jgi:hypothetical protein
MVKKTVEIETKVSGDSQAKSKLGKLGDFIKSRLVITMGDLVRVGKSVLGFFKDFSTAAQVQEDATTKLNAALRNQGIFTETLSRALQKQAAEIQKVTKFGDEQIILLQSMLLNFGIMPQDIDKVTRATLDLATATGMDLKAATSLIAKSLGSSTNALARYGIQIEGAVGSSERLDSAIKNIADKFGGQALAATENYAGATAQLNNNWGDLQETLGQAANDSLKPLIVQLSKATVATNNFFKEFLGVGTESEKLEFRINSLKRGIENLESQFDPLGTYKKTIKERKDLLGELEEQLKKVLQQAKEQEEADQKALEAQQKRTEQQKKANEAKEKAIQLEEAMKKASGDAGKAQADMLDARIKGYQELTDLMGSITDDQGKTILESFKQGLKKQIDAWMATEIAKNFYNPIAIAGIVGAGTAGKAAINAVKFAQGGQFDRTNVSTTTSGQTAIDNERGLERVTVEPIGQPESSSGRPIQVVIQMNGKTLAKQLYPEIQAIERKIS